MSRVLGVLMLIFLFAFALGASVVARAADLPTPDTGQAICEKDGPRCIVRKEDVAHQNVRLQEAADALRSQQQAIEVLEREVQKLRAIKGCAKVEVLPKPVPPPGTSRT